MSVGSFSKIISPHIAVHFKPFCLVPPSCHALIGPVASAGWKAFQVALPLNACRCFVLLLKNSRPKSRLGIFLKPKGCCQPKYHCKPFYPLCGVILYYHCMHDGAVCYHVIRIMFSPDDSHSCPPYGLLMTFDQENSTAFNLAMYDKE